MRVPAIASAIAGLTFALWAPQQAPVFRAAAELVEINAVVTDRGGAVVRGLTREDFQVAEDGRAQEIVQFSFVDIPAPQPGTPGARGSVPAVPSDVATNAHPPDRRMYVIVLDAFNVDPSRSTQVRKQARQFIEDNLGPNDLAAVMQLGRSSAHQQFTSHKTLLIGALDGFIGHKPQSATLNIMRDEMLRPQNAPQDFESGARANEARRMLESIKQVCESLGTTRGYRRSVVLFSEGIDFDTSDLIGEDKRPGAGGKGLTHESAKHAGLVLQAQQDLFVAARRANVAIYAIDPRGNTMGEDLQMQSGSAPPGLAILNEAKRGQGVLRTIAEQTGGLAVVNTGDFKAGFSDIVQANSSYYIVGYSPTNTTRDGKYRRISVTVRRPDVSITARKGYFASAAATAAANPPATPAPNAASPRMRQLLASSLPVGGLDLRLAGGPVRGHGDKVLVALVLEIDTKNLPFAEKDGLLANDIELAFLAMDAAGKLQAGHRTVGNLRLPPADRAALANGLRYVVEFPASPGRYQVRMAAHESAGDSGGSALVDVDVPDLAKAPLSIGTIVVTSSSALATPTTGTYPLLKALLAEPPTAAREFATRDTVVAFASVSDSTGKATDSVAITTVVLGADGREAFRAQKNTTGADLSPKQNGYGHVSSIPLGAVAAGRYMLTIDAKSSSGKTATRSIAFTVR